MEEQVRQSHSTVQLEDVLHVAQGLQRITHALRVHADRMLKEYLQTFTPRYLLNSIYNESTSELSHEYQLVSRLIEEFPIYSQDALNAIYKKTVELLVSDNYQPAEIVALATLFREVISLILGGVGALLAMSDALITHHYQQGIMRGIKRPLEEKMKFGVINIPLRKGARSIETFSSSEDGDGKKDEE